MLHKLEKRCTLLVVLAVISVIFSATLGYLTYTGAQALARQQSDTNARLAKIDKQIAVIKAKKAEAEAAKKAAEQKASSNEALASQLQGNIVTPKGCAISGAHGNPNMIDVVINKKHCFNPINYVPSDLVGFQGYLVSAKLLSNLQAMIAAAQAAGVPIGLTSSYRSYTDQVVTYNHWVAVNGSYAAADTVSARPGYSEHQTGLALDLDTTAGCSLECFANSDQYRWLQENAATYGFIERYPVGLTSVTGYSPEAWHWRYVGPVAAQDMKLKGIKTLEQYWNITGGDY